MRIAICDDREEDRDALRQYAADFFSEKNMEAEVSVFASGEALRGAQGTPFDLILLDIELGDDNGIRLAGDILRKHRNTVIIVVTSYGHYLDDAMDLHVLRFITKPATRERVFSALARALSELEEHTLPVPLLSHAILQLPVGEIVYLEAHMKRVTVCAVGGRYETRKPLKEFRVLLPAGCFGVPHASFLVNLHYIREFSRNEIKLARPYDAVRIPVTNRKQALFRKQFMAFIGEDH